MESPKEGRATLMWAIKFFRHHVLGSKAANEARDGQLVSRGKWWRKLLSSRGSEDLRWITSGIDTTRVCVRADGSKTVAPRATIILLPIRR